METISNTIYHKDFTFNIVLLAVIGVLVGCKSSNPREDYFETNTLNDTLNVISAPLDTSYHFIKEVLNSSPTEVELILGSADYGYTNTEDCGSVMTSCIEATYQNGLFQILYYKNKAKYVYFQQTDLFTKDAIKYLGFPKWQPTIENLNIISWRGSSFKNNRGVGELLPVKGINHISIFAPTNKSYKGYVLIELENDYNSKF